MQLFEGKKREIFFKKNSRIISFMYLYFFLPQVQDEIFNPTCMLKYLYTFHFISLSLPLLSLSSYSKMKRESESYTIFIK